MDAQIVTPAANSRRFIAGGIACLMAAPVLCQAQFGPADFQRVDEYVEARLTELNIPGVATRS